MKNETAVTAQSLAFYKERIETAQKQGNSSILAIAGALAAIAENKLYEEQGCKDIYQYAKDTHGISRGSVSEAINVFKMYGDASTGSLLPEFQAYTFNQLVEMRKLPEIEQKNVVPETSVRELKEKVKTERAKKSVGEKKERKTTLDMTFGAESPADLIKKLKAALEGKKFDNIKSINIKVKVEKNNG